MKNWLTFEFGSYHTSDSSWHAEGVVMLDPSEVSHVCEFFHMRDINPNPATTIYLQGGGEITVAQSISSVIAAIQSALP